MKEEWPLHRLHTSQDLGTQTPAGFPAPRGLQPSSSSNHHPWTNEASVTGLFISSVLFIIV